MKKVTFVISHYHTHYYYLDRARELARVPVEEFFTMGHGETLLLGEPPAHDYAVKHPK